MPQVNLRIDDELLERVDRARGDVPRNRWLLRAVEAALDGSKALMDRELPAADAEDRVEPAESEPVGGRIIGRRLTKRAQPRPIVQKR